MTPTYHVHFLQKFLNHSQTCDLALLINFMIYLSSMQSVDILIASALYLRMNLGRMDFLNEYLILKILYTETFHTEM